MIKKSFFFAWVFFLLSIFSLAGFGYFTRNAVVHLQMLMDAEDLSGINHLGDIAGDIWGMAGLLVAALVFGGVSIIIFLRVVTRKNASSLQRIAGGQPNNSQLSDPAE